MEDFGPIIYFILLIAFSIFRSLKKKKEKAQETANKRQSDPRPINKKPARPTAEAETIEDVLKELFNESEPEPKIEFEQKLEMEPQPGHMVPSYDQDLASYQEAQQIERDRDRAKVQLERKRKSRIQAENKANIDEHYVDEEDESGFQIDLRQAILTKEILTPKYF